MKKSTAFAAGVLTGVIIVITSNLVQGEVPALEEAMRIPPPQVSAMTINVNRHTGGGE